MRACARCGQENPEGFRFCGACGAPLERAEAPREVRKTVTVVFCDLTGSTALGERLDPETVRATMRRYFEDSRAILERHGGTVEKFIGDAVMAVFGVPQAHEDDALRAVRAAVELRAAVATIGLQARIGVNTGEVVAGEGDALVTGDAVNVAARLEQNAEPGEILIGQETQQLVRDAVQVEPSSSSSRARAHPSRRIGCSRSTPSPPASSDASTRRSSVASASSSACATTSTTWCRSARRTSSRCSGRRASESRGSSRSSSGETADRARILRGHCLHYGEGITYWPLVEVLLQLGADAEAVLALPSPRGRRCDTEAARERGRRAATRRRLGRHPVGGAAFLDLIEHIADWSRGAPIFVLCVARPELLAAPPRVGRRQGERHVAHARAARERRNVDADRQPPQRRRRCSTRPAAESSKPRRATRSSSRRCC